jgi:hypothetical protein
MGRAQPAVPTEHRGDVSRSLASVIAKVEKTEPERHEAADRVGVVAPFITPLLVGRVRRGPVEFHAHSELLVEIVEVSITRALPDPRLPASCGQPVRALHPVDVAILQYRKRAAFGVAKCDRDLPAPAHLLASGHGNSNPISGGASAADGPADPRVRVIEVCRDLDEVENRVLDPGAWREHCRVPGPQDGIRPVDDDVRDLRPRWAPRRWDRDGDDRTWLIDQAVPLGCCLVAQYRIGSGPEQGGPEQSLPRWIPREGRVYASLKPLPAATAHSVAHRVRIDADHGALSTGNGVCLTGKSLFREHGAHAADASGLSGQVNIACG